jgi:hypothetical protein
VLSRKGKKYTKRNGVNILRKVNKTSIVKAVLLLLIIGILVSTNSSVVMADNVRTVSNKLPSGDLYEFTYKAYCAGDSDDNASDDSISVDALNASITTGGNYDSLANDDQRKIYTALATAFSNPGTSADPDGGTPGVIKNGYYLTQNGTISNDFGTCIYAYTYDHIDDLNPFLCDVFFMYYEGGDVYVYANYNDSSVTSSKVQSMENALKSARSKFVSSIDTRNKSKYEIELTVHDALVKKVQYGELSSSAGGKNICHTAYGALVDSVAVCDGYSSAFLYVLDYYGIEARIVTGDAGGGHAWNVVQLDNDWYEVDTTWDDATDQKYIFYTYFNITTQTMDKGRTRDTLGSYQPVANGTKYAYTGSEYRSIENDPEPVIVDDDENTNDGTSGNGGISNDGSSNNGSADNSSSSNNSSNTSLSSTGDVYTDANGYKYMITSNNEVSLIRLPSDINKNKKKYKTLTIANSVNIGGKNYNVTEVSFENGSQKLKYTKKLVISANVKSISKNSFKNAKKLNSVIIKGNLTSVGKNAFKNVSNKTVFKLNKNYYKNNKKLLKKAKTNKKVKYEKA